MPRAGPKKVQEYSAEFKLEAVRLSRQRGVQVQAVAAALDIHPFMLSRWRKAVRDWSNGVSWTVGIVTFLLVNAVRALLRSLLLPDHVRLTGLLGLILWFGWLLL